MTRSLFSPDPVANLLPYDGIVQDYGVVLGEEEADDYLQTFLTALAWQHDEVKLFGQYYRTARQVAWYADAAYTYVYSGMPKQAQIWHPDLFQLKQKIEQRVGHLFNSCLANLYADGQQAMGWHSDNESTLGQQPVIASLSLGATRKFRFKHQQTQSHVDCMLQHGQLLVMRGTTQQYWKHCITKSARVIEPRINLTFRYFYPHNEKQPLD